MVELKVLLYQSDGTIMFQTDFNENLKNFPPEKNTASLKVDNHIYPNPHDGPLKISAMKWKHLQELKEAMPKDCHNFYDSLLYKE